MTELHGKIGSPASGIRRGQLNMGSMERIRRKGVIRFIVRFPAVGYCFAAAVTAEDALKAKAISWV
ncbi:TPA: hypothetical protein ACRNT3_006278, partial [Pseudomonas aeruginosa]